MLRLWWNGIHNGLKIRRRKLASSNLASRTTSEQATYRLLRFFAKNRSALISLLLLSAKSHARLACSLASALTTARCRYQLFAVPPAGGNIHSIISIFYDYTYISKHPLCDSFCRLLEILHAIISSKYAWVPYGNPETHLNTLRDGRRGFCPC